ncbi:MAG: TetR/AcrR family transcriptional regulator [Clostridiales bacterium]|nr:TetR/AcrR family transcriptional regulator [Clostridiales bacterium]
MNRNESKYFNTAKKMQEALIQLLDRKEFELISVKEICAEAGVNRSTFYLHYDNTSDLLVETMENVYKDFLSRYEEQQKENELNIKESRKNDLFLMTPEYIDPYLDFVRENRKLFKLMNDKYQVMGTEKMYEQWFNSIFTPILSRFGVPQDEQPYIMTFYLKGLIGLVNDWVNDDCSMSNDKIMQILNKCIIDPKDM